MQWTIDSFPLLEAFCKRHDITFALTFNPVYHIVKFIFKYDRRTLSRNFDEGELDNLWHTGIQKDLIDAIKKEFCIYDSAVEAYDVMRNAELWGVFNKPLDEKFYTQNFKFDNVFNPYPYGEYNKIVKLYNERKDNKMKRKESIAMPKGFGNFQMVGIKKVIFNDPATIIIWTDDVKTIVKAENEPYDPEKGMAIAIAKRALGNEGNYYDIFKKWIPKKDKSSAMKEMAEKLTNMLLDPKVSTEEYKKGYEEAIKESIKLIDSFKEEKKEPEVIGKVKDVKKTDNGVVVEAEVSDDVDSTFKDSFF